VTNVSGRGVGMDVVRKNIQSLGGRISIDSTPGKGSKFSMSLPLTLAVMDGMVVEIGREKYVLPLANIIQSLRPEPDEISALPDGRNLMMFRGDYISLVPLYDIFKVQDAQRDPCNGLVVVVEGEGGVLMGFIVDDLVNQQQVVIKSLEENYELVEGVSGATILGNGLVSLIVDIAAVQSLSSGPYELSETSPRPSESKTEVRYQ
jgi:two-component system chemotaxis sensor kinase CheA